MIAFHQLNFGFITRIFEAGFRVIGSVFHSPAFDFAFQSLCLGKLYYLISTLTKIITSTHSEILKPDSLTSTG